jgi:hypothetical protein
LEFNVEGSGKIVTTIPYVTGKITVPVKLRLEFIRLMTKPTPAPVVVAPKSDDSNIFSPDMTDTEKKIATQTKSLLDKLSQEVTLAYSEQVKEDDMKKRSVALKYIEVGLGMGVKENCLLHLRPTCPLHFLQKFELPLPLRLINRQMKPISSIR